MTKKEDDKVGATAVVTETIHDRSAVLSLKQVHTYTDRMVERGHAEYNKGSILVKSKHPLDQCLKRGIIEDQHYESGKRIRNYRDCTLSKLSGRTYNATGEGDSEMDAATVYANVMRTMNGTPGGKNHWKLISLVCFTEPDINGEYFTEMDYRMLYRLAPNIQASFEAADEAFGEARRVLQDKINTGRKKG